jgi:hypothetical protein
MANFVIGTKVTTTEPTVSVDVSANSFIPAGVHHFQLIVVDDAGNASDPATAQIIIKDTVKPTAVLAVVPTQVDPAVSFRLDGTKSSDVPPGKIAQYIWTLID